MGVTNVNTLKNYQLKIQGHAISLKETDNCTFVLTKDKNKYKRHETHLHLAPWTVGLERIDGPGGRELSGYYIRRSFKTGEKRK